MILAGESRKKFLRHNNIIGSRENFDVLYFKVEVKSRISFTNNLFMSVRCIILLITDKKFNNTCFTNSRDIRELIDSSCLKKFFKNSGGEFKTDIFARKCNLFVRRSDNYRGISKERVESDSFIVLDGRSFTGGRFHVLHSCH